MIEWIISSSVLIMLVMAMRNFLRRKLTMRAWYALWLLVAVRLLVPVSFAESSLSVLNLFRFADTAQEAGPEDGQAGADGLYGGASAGGIAPKGNAGLQGTADKAVSPVGDDMEKANDAGKTSVPVTDKAKEPGADSGAGYGQWTESGAAVGGTAGADSQSVRVRGTETDAVDGSGESVKSSQPLPAWKKALMSRSPLWYVWLSGVLLSAGSILILNTRYRKRVYRSRKRYRAGDKSRLPVYVCPVVDCPCMFGLAHPAVYLSAEAAARPEVLGYVLCHENVHFCHHDNLWVAVRAACLCLHWYNPLVWIAAAMSEQDGELACDERTLELLGQEERIRYGRALLDFSAGGGVWQRGWKLSTAMSSGKKLLKERLMVIVGEPRKHAGAMAAVLLLAVLFATATFTGKVSGKEPDGEDPAAGYGQGSGMEPGGDEDDGEVWKPGAGTGTRGGENNQESCAESSAIVSIDLNDGEEYTLKISGEAILESGEYRIRQIQLNRLKGREEEVLQIIRLEDVRTLYTRSLEEIKNDDGQMYSYALKGEPLFAKPLCTAADIPAREVGKFLEDENGEVLSQAPDGQIVVADLNFDGYQDFCIQAGTNTVNVPYYCYLWNPAEGRFDAGYMIPNVEVDREAQLVKSATRDGDGQRSVKYYSFDQYNLLHMVRYVEENQSPEAFFRKLDLTYCEVYYGLPAVDEWDYGTRYGGALPERFVYWAKEALTELYEWSGTKIDRACFTMTSFGSVSFGNTPEELNASLVYYDRSYGARAGFEDIIEQMGVVTERTVWFSPIVQWNKPDNLNEMLDIELVEWYFERSPLSEGEKLESVERVDMAVYTIKAESGKYYQIFLTDATREMSAMYGPYDSRPE